MVKKFANLKKKPRIKEMFVTGKQKLSAALASNIPIYWLDECIFSTKTYQYLDWSPKGNNVELKST